MMKFDPDTDGNDELFATRRLKKAECALLTPDPLVYGSALAAPAQDATMYVVKPFMLLYAFTGPEG